uniref:Uncharacterized protein n=1 Tax=Anguilla anguilla TaxID=7936 RepID=A0A0E9XQ51_ANGAN
MISYILAKTLTRPAFRILSAQTRKRPRTAAGERVGAINVTQET